MAASIKNLRSAIVDSSGFCRIHGGVVLRFRADGVDALRSLLHGLPLCFGLLDIDHFKRINDNFSHDVGDQALKLVADVMAGELGSGRVARWGGEEFALLFVGLDVAQSRELCERVRQAIERVDCGQFAPGLKITASIGLAERTGLPHRERLVSRADQKLYEAKNGGRNRVVS